MKEPVFNIHDIALILIFGECAILALLFLVNRGSKPVSHRLLAVFLLLNTMISLHTLILWGEAIRFKVFDFSPNIFFLFSFAFFLQGPILYWYTKSIIYKDFCFIRKDFWHLLPSLLTPAYLYFVYYRHSLELKRSLALNFEIYGTYDWNFNWFVHMQKSITVIYGALCLYQLFKYRQTIKNNYSDTESIDLTWLLLLAGGFLFTWLWILMTHFVGFAHLYEIAGTMGIIGNYLTCVLINVLVFYSLINIHKIDGIQLSHEEKSDRLKDDVIDPNNVKRILDAMEVDKVFLNSRLTLEEFAKRTQLPSRVVSGIINNQLNQNFHEFVNKYRVEEAQRILAQPDESDSNVLEIATRAGFNSKPAFNRFFKKLTGMTPTEFRDQHSHNLN